MATQEDFNLERFKKAAITGLYAGKKMTCTDGVLAPIVKHFSGIDDRIHNCPFSLIYAAAVLGGGQVSSYISRCFYNFATYL